MKVNSYQAYNPKAVLKFKLESRLSDSLSKTNSILGYVKEINPGVFDEYIEVFQSRMLKVIGQEETEIDLLRVTEIVQNLKHLKDYPPVITLVIRYFLHQLEIDHNLEDLDKEIEVFSFNHACENERLRYYLAICCADLLGREKGIELWKQVVSLMLRDERIEYERREKDSKKTDEKEISMTERSDRAIKRWKETGLGIFTRAILDDHKVLYRFDKCITPEALREMEDPEFAYLSSCYIGDAPNFNFGKQFLRRTQTLHQGEFCDELYWDPRVHDNPEQPSLEFTKNLGKE